MNNSRIVAFAAAWLISNMTVLATGAEPARSQAADACPIVTVVETGMPLPDGGSLVINSAGIINRKKDVAFVARINESERNWGVFVAGPSGLREIIRGCGATGGQGGGGVCGDPTPIGGTFGGLFDHNNLEPRMNDSGDVVFLADVSNGSSARGLFLYKAADQTLVKVVALGDSSPRGGTIEAIGNGVVSDQGQVAFLAWDAGTNNSDSYLALWDEGSLEVAVAPGDPTPQGGVVELVSNGTAGFPDGTRVLLSPTPSFGDSGRLAASVAGTTSNGVLLFENDISSWLIREGDPVPGGGVFTSVGIPMLRNGRATFASANPDGAFIGTPGGWQPVWIEGQTLDGALIESIDIASGRHILDDRGQVTLYVVVQDGDTFVSMFARWNESDGLVPFVKRMDEAPGGGTVWGFNEEVSVNRAGDVVLNLFIGRSGELVSGLFRIDNCLASEIFADGFESGNTDLWSISRP